MAGIVPGLLLALLLSATIVGIAIRNPAGAPPVIEDCGPGEKWRARGAVLPILILAVLVIGSI